jgi:hypothetical protein
MLLQDVQGNGQFVWFVVTPSLPYTFGEILVLCALFPRSFNPQLQKLINLGNYSFTSSYNTGTVNGPKNF